MGSNVRLDHKGIAAILKGAPIAAAVKRAAERVAQNVRDQEIKVGGLKGNSGKMDLPVTVTMSTTDRARARVTIAHPAGLAVQAKHGALTKAAAQAGLGVRSRK